MNKSGDSDSAAPMRLSILGIIVFSLFASLFVRLWYLQAVSRETLTIAAQANAQRTVFVPAPRGRILDRNGLVLVSNRVVQVLTVQRQAVKDDPDLTVRIAAALGKSNADVQAKLTDQRQNPLVDAEIAEEVPIDKIVYLKEHSDQFAGVNYRQKTERVFPQGNVAAHILGYVNQINGDELKAGADKGYRTGDEIGKTGIEKAYEDVLRGKPGKIVLEVDRRNQVLRTVSQDNPIPGADLFLTIDMNLQIAAEQSLASAVETARTLRDTTTGRHFVAPAGAAVAVDPRDGSVRAMASFPTYDPSQFVGGISNDEYAALQEAGAGAPLNNRATSGLYAPGSTFKLFTADAALRDGLVAPSTSINDQGLYTVEGKCSGKCSYSNANNTSFGTVNLPKAITVSSDVYFYRLGDQFYQQRDRFPNGIQNVAAEYGLGAPTGIEIAESKGRVACEECRAKLHEDRPAAFPNAGWFVGDNIMMAIGQVETAVTPLQLANAYASFGNGGTVWTGHLGLKAVAADGTVVMSYEPKALQKVGGGDNVHSAIIEGLVGVVNNPAGTAYTAFAGSGLANAGWSAAGKTGTAEVDDRKKPDYKQDTALFAGFAPYNDPQIAVSVVIEQAGYGGTIAAPTARRIMQVAAGIAPDPVSAAIAPSAESH